MGAPEVFGLGGPAESEPPPAFLDADDAEPLSDRAGPVDVLLIDDDEDDYLLLDAMLDEALGLLSYRVTWAPDPEAARHRLAQGSFDVIVLDHYLGPTTGLELLPELRERSSAPIIMLTGQGNRDLDAAAMRGGASDYLTKDGLTGEVLERSVRHAIERQRTQRALRASEERYRTLIASLQEGVIVLARDGRVLMHNQSAARLLDATPGVTPANLRATFPIELIREDGTPFPLDSRPNRVTLRTGEPQRGVVMGLRIGDGSIQWLSVNTQPLDRPGERDPYAVIASFVDVTEQVETFQALRHHAFHDALTGLPNRLLFMDRLSQALRHAPRAHELVGIGLIDLDRFKVVNDTLGHAAGDEALRLVARRLEVCSRDSDTFARLGGDEFTVLLRDVRNADDVNAIARRVIEAFEKPFTIAGQQVHLTASLGMALAPDHGIDPETLLKQADRAAYWVKDAGRNSFALFDPANAREVSERIQLENDLRAALGGAELELDYQPQIDLVSGDVVGIEALVRWRHPRRGRVPPGDFIPIAEESGLIVPLGTWVLREACRQARAWLSERPELRLAVNVSAIQFRRHGFPATVRHALEETGFPPGQLELEVTETAVMTDVRASIRHMRELKELGLRIAIDDFGTGYSSLAYLQRLPIDVVKIDREFVSTVETPAGNLLVHAITDLAHRLGIEITAEGIETPNQLAMVREMGCQLGQGFLFGAPAPRPPLTAVDVGLEEAQAALRLDRVHPRLHLFGRCLETVPAGILITDPSNRILFANRAFLARAGLTGAEVLGRVPRTPRTASNETGDDDGTTASNTDFVDVRFGPDEGPILLQLRAARRNPGDER